MRENVILAGVELVAIGEESGRKAARRVVGCQSCTASVTHPFSSVLVEVLGVGRTNAEYVLCSPAHCPNCNQAIFEHTLVRCEGDDLDGADLDFGRCWDSV